jgi:hypothetical protein
LALKIPYVSDYVTKLCRKQAGVIQNYLNPNVRAIGQGEAMHRKHKRLTSKLGGGQTYDYSGDLQVNLAVVRPTTIQVTNSRFGVVK